MARRNRSSAPAVENRPSKSLEKAFPSSPTRSPRYGFYCRNSLGHFIYQNFFGRYAAKRFVEVITEGSPYRWVNHGTIVADNGVTLSTSSDGSDKGPELEEVIEHEYTTAEEEWEIPEPYASQWRRFPTKEDRQTASAPPRRHSDRPARSSDNVTISTIAEQCGVEPSRARGILRKANEPKPPQGWEWGSEEAERIRVLIRKG